MQGLYKYEVFNVLRGWWVKNRCDDYYQLSKMCGGIDFGIQVMI